ncbi:MAG: DUF2075 domain-containing protein, partial [Patescibacteria group bacterium]|nr:DUF2075 domain-containing protein [Patescibacteria group bacterium]
MRLYAGTATDFIKDAVQNQIALKLANAFFEYKRYYPPESEKRSWRESLSKISGVFQYLHFQNQGVILEYQLPLNSKRLDCIICGKDEKGNDNAVIIELKQWEKCQSTLSDKVITFVGSANREVLHPAVQVGQYQMYLKDNLTVFYEDENKIDLNSCSYLHNYFPGSKDPLFDEIYKNYYEKFPVFCADKVTELQDYLSTKVAKGEGIKIINKIDTSQFKASRSLLKHVNKVIKENQRYILIDEQLVAFEKVMAIARNGLNKDKKTAIIIKGGPGTGKSVIAINLMAELSKQEFNTQYSTGSKAFTESLRKSLGTKAAMQIKYFNSYINADENLIDVLIADESHRIRYSSNNRFTRSNNRSNLPQIEELIKVAKLPVFFIDDHQNVRPNEIGSVKYIKENAIRLGCEVFEYQLEIQFRCQGSDKFVQWIENTLGTKKTPQILWNPKQEVFDFKIVSSPHELWKIVEEKNKEEPNSARMVAGFCWPWSFPKSDGTLVKDVKIGDFEMTWEAKEGSSYRLAEGIPPASLWPLDPRAVNQIGSIYTIQGFEFDYVGVIFGKDLIYNFEKQSWEGHKENSSDEVVKRSGERFTDYAKNVY